MDQQDPKDHQVKEVNPDHPAPLVSQVMLEAQANPDQLDNKDLEDSPVSKAHLVPVVTVVKLDRQDQVDHQDNPDLLALVERMGVREQMDREGNLEHQEHKDNLVILVLLAQPGREVLMVHRVNQALPDPEVNQAHRDLADRTEIVVSQVVQVKQGLQVHLDLLVLLDHQAKEVEQEPLEQQVL